jgi:leukotriene-A4 hydrolase
MHGEACRQFKSIGGWKDLKDTILKTLGEKHPFTSLVINLAGVDPDDSFSTVPYEKGYVFLYYLEEKVGGADTFEPFFKAYVQKYQQQSIDTNTFKDFFTNYFTAEGKGNLIADIDWDTWLYSPGMPPYTPKYDTSFVEVCSELKAKWDNWNPTTAPSPFSKSDLEKFTMESAQLEEFLAQLLDDDKAFPLEKAIAMQAAYELNGRKNSEIRFRWLRLCIKAKWLEQVQLALDFVTEQGRMKFIRPIYRDLYAWEAVRAKTIETFKRNRPNMMYVSAYTVAKDLHLNE